VTGIIVFVLTGISVFLAPILKVKQPRSPIPAPSLQIFGDLERKTWISSPDHGPHRWSPSLGRSCRLPWGERRVFSMSPVHPHAGALRRLSVHGRRFAERHPGECSSSSSSSSLMAVKGFYAGAKRGILTPKFACVQYFQLHGTADIQNPSRNIEKPPILHFGGLKEGLFGSLGSGAEGQQQPSSPRSFGTAASSSSCRPSTNPTTSSSGTCRCVASTSSRWCRSSAWPSSGSSNPPWPPSSSPSW